MTSIQEFLAKASAQAVQLRISDLLAIWGFRARTFDSVARVQRDLNAAGLRCEPGLGDGALDSVVRVGIPMRAETQVGEKHGEAESDVDVEEQDEPLRLPPVALLIKHIPSANREVACVRPDQSLAEAQAMMSAHDYSQLAVMSGPRDLKGAVSWKSIAQARLGKREITLTDATLKPAPVVHADDELLGKIASISQTGFVFVQSEGDRICGVVTAADISDQFHDLTTPFFQLGEIERRLRRCIERVFSTTDLRTASGVDSAAKMVFGQYVRLLNNEARWQRMGWAVDRAMFIGYLDAARLVRNRVMHFGEDLTPEEKYRLVQCLNFMRALDPLP